MKHLTPSFALILLLMASAPAALAQETRIESLAPDGTLTWTNSTLYATCTIEWANTVEGPWYDSWSSLTNVFVTNQVMSAPVPRFYRIVSQAPPPQQISNLTASQALALIQDRAGDAVFHILDVRTPLEYATRHIVGSLNLDLRSPGFGAALSALDRRHAYLVYCASGNRSGQAVEQMRLLGFREVSNLLGGIGTFAALTEAASYLEP